MDHVLHPCHDNVTLGQNTLKYPIWSLMESSVSFTTIAIVGIGSFSEKTCCYGVREAHNTLPSSPLVRKYKDCLDTIARLHSQASKFCDSSWILEVAKKFKVEISISLKASSHHAYETS
ncbi:hypothetical protein VNO77_44055 [Canavalia gladiata]|uniref:Uncharacterized protein n=1 Tax=Canavalia gladiata TaxID=3824 RepID=A0AAN9JXI5_CANGL